MAVLGAGPLGLELAQAFAQEFGIRENDVVIQFAGRCQLQAEVGSDARRLAGGDQQRGDQICRSPPRYST